MTAAFRVHFLLIAALCAVLTASMAPAHAESELDRAYRIIAGKQLVGLIHSFRAANTALGRLWPDQILARRRLKRAWASSASFCNPAMNAKRGLRDLGQAQNENFGTSIRISGNEQWLI